MPRESARTHPDHAAQQPHAEHQHEAHGIGEHGADFDAQWWDKHYRQLDQPGVGSIGIPSPYVTGLGDGIQPDGSRGAVLDAGCGTGADAVWLAEHGWDVTAVDISPTAIERARGAAAGTGADSSAAIDWVVADVLTWAPPQQYAAVVSQYVHPHAPYDAFVQRLASAVAPGGRLVIVGHDHGDSHSHEHAPRDVAVGPAAVTTALDEKDWTVETAHTRRRTVTHGGSELDLTDAVVIARRRGLPGVGCTRSGTPRPA